MISHNFIWHDDEPWLADGRELASGMGRGGAEWEHVVLRSGGHALIAPPAAAGTNAMGHRRTPRALSRPLALP